MNTRAGLLTITIRKSSQSVHMHHIITSSLILLCCMPWKCRNNSEYLWETGTTTNFEQYMRILLRNYDTTIQIPKSDCPGPTNPRNSIQSLQNHQTPTSVLRDARSITDRVMHPKQKSQK
jgi:hypothetical protein